MSSSKPSKWSSRLGNAVRRSSSILAISRPTTPSADSDSASLSKVEATSRILTPPAIPQVVSHPTPIPESPAREAAATESVPAGPSPLSQEPSTTAEPTEHVEEAVTSPADWVHPPLVDTTAGNPGAFIDDADQLPPTGPIQDPYAPSTKPPSVIDPPPETQAEPGSYEPQMETSKSYFDKPVAESIKDFDPHEGSAGQFAYAVPPEDHSQPLDQPIERSVSAQPSSHAVHVEPVHSDPPSIPDMEHGEAASYYRGDVEEVKPSAPSIVEQTPIHEDPLPKREPGHEDVIVPSWAGPSHNVPQPSYSLPPYSGQDVWGGPPLEETKGYGTDKAYDHHPFGDLPSMPIPKPAENGNGHPNTNVQNGNGHPIDPFSEPPKQVFADLHFPQAEPSQHPQMPEESHEDAHGSFILPLPAREEVMSAPTFHRIPSAETDYGQLLTHDTNENMPLLARPQPTSYLASGAQTRVYVSPLDPSTSTAWQQQANQPRLHELGWLEYHLPDGTIYYVHPTRRVTTDCNLRSERTLNQVSGYLDDSKDSPSGPAASELWLRDVGNSKKGFIPVRCWVDHNGRSVVPDYTSYGAGKGKKQAEEDQLDVEYRYWAYVEGHPAHNPLPAKAKAEALDVLNWAWTDRLLPSTNAVPAPFTQEECQELMTLLRSFSADESQNENGIQSRIVSRILLRVAQWRQAYFRPNKPLPKDVATAGSRLPLQRRPIRRAVVDFLISCVCLGIPYLFIERTRHGRFDEESGLRHASPMIVIGACTCLVAAIVLSASVTFLSLPGLDNFSRTAGIVAILFATFSLVATIVSIFRHKSDMERPVSHVGVEGLVMISRRTIVLSLPLVFLTYAIIGFAVGIILYTFRGVTVNDPTLGKSFFEEYTRWVVIGLGGALAGIFATSLLLLGR